MFIKVKKTKTIEYEELEKVQMAGYIKTPIGAVTHACYKTVEGGRRTFCGIPVLRGYDKTAKRASFDENPCKHCLSKMVKEGNK